jgi:hypothetical protein
MTPAPGRELELTDEMPTPSRSPVDLENKCPAERVPSSALCLAGYAGEPG